MGPGIALLAVIGIGIFGVSTEHSDIAHQNKTLKTKVLELKKNQVPTVKKLDGVQIKNLSDSSENTGAEK